MLQRFIGDIKKHYKYAYYSARAQLNAEVSGSYLNWVWWVLQPFCMMIVYAIVFGFIFGAREEYFTAFIFIGISVWDFFNRDVKQSIKL
ncbi:MAG: polysaccharide ABC transporter, partial [Lachnospiraceae bacterium]|nr:polysaccharide ABC transporter [Lachnospiraceae bacterium]